MKLTVSRLFEAGAVLEAFNRAKIEGIEGFVTFLSDFSENVIRGLRGQLTFRDNFLYEEKTVQLVNGVFQDIQLTSKNGLPARMVWVGKTTPSTAFITGFQWEMTIDGSLRVTANFSPIPTSGKVEVLLAIFY